jgi:hypothetical protein
MSADLSTIIHRIDLDLDHLRSELDRVKAKITEAEAARHYLLSMHKTSAADMTAHSEKSIPTHEQPRRGRPRKGGGTQKQRIINMAIAILTDRQNKPIQRDELWEEMQRRGLTLTNRNPTHYVASKVMGDAKDIFANRNGYYLLEFPRPE